MNRESVARLHGLNYKGNYTEVKVDLSGRLPQIEFEHLAVHEDGIVIASDISTAGTTGVPIVYAIIGEAGKEYHCKFLVDNDVPYTVRLYDTPSSNVTGGTPIVHGRYNRKSTISDTEIVPTYLAPTIATDTGTLIYHKHSGGSTSRANIVAIGGSVRAGEEYIVDSGTVLTIHIAPDQNGGKCNFSNDFYDVNIL